MSDQRPPATRLTLIAALREGLRWEEFVALYGRLILYWGRRDFGLQEPDAENLCQDVLLKVWQGIRGYDPARGRFRSWLYACTRNTVVNLRRRRGEVSGEDLPEPTADPGPAWQDAEELDAALRAVEQEGYATAGLEEAVLQVRARVRPDTWKAFLLFEFFDLTAREIGPRLGLTPTAVGQAVHRVRQLLRQAAGQAVS